MSRPESATNMVFVDQWWIKCLWHIRLWVRVPPNTQKSTKSSLQLIKHTNFPITLSDSIKTQPFLFFFRHILVEHNIGHHYNLVIRIPVITVSDKSLFVEYRTLYVIFVTQFLNHARFIIDVPNIKVQTITFCQLTLHSL